MRVLVTGGRSYGSTGTFYDTLDFIDPTKLEEVICGGATGADALAIQWAMHRKVNFRVFYAKWDEHGKGAGPIRNQQMLDETKPDLVIAFPGGTGTADMVKRAGDAGVEVVKVGS